MKEYNVLEPRQWEYLDRHFQLSVCADADSARFMAVAGLLDEGECAAYLDRLSDKMQASSRRVAASQFVKRYAFLYAASGLYAMTMYNRGLDLSLGNSFLSVPEGGAGKWQPALSFKNGRITSPAAGKREEWREEAVGTLFGEHVGPLLRSISKAAAIPLPVLWENIAVRIYSLYEKRLGEGGGSEEAARIGDDYYYLVHEARPDLFGEKDNPLAVFYGKPSASAFPKPAVRMRKTCCLYYKIAPDQSCCDACPIG